MGDLSATSLEQPHLYHGGRNTDSMQGLLG